MNANQVIALPRSETTCPSQMMVKAFMPAGDFIVDNYYGYLLDSSLTHSRQKMTDLQIGCALCALRCSSWPISQPEAHAEDQHGGDQTQQVSVSKGLNGKRCEGDQVKDEQE